MSEEVLERDLDEEFDEKEEKPAGADTSDKEKSKVEASIPYDRFKAKVDEANALKKKLADIKEAEEEARRQKLEETENYKELYEESLKTIRQQKEESLNIVKESLLLNAGYSEDQTAMFSQLLKGETKEEIEDSLEEIKKIFPAESKKKYYDPGLGNGLRDKPEKVDQYDIGRSMFSRIKGIKE